MRASSATVVSLIGVLEHLANPREFLNAFALSNARFLYVSVPMFSLSALLQRAFPTVAPRHLGGGHTHLFTRRSLEYMESTRGLNVRTEWWFGSDVLDIWRSLLVSSAGQPGDALGFEDFLAELLWAHIDDLQAVLDRARACSEVHLLFERREWVRAIEQE